jgi:FkbM family methyltransferase
MPRFYELAKTNFLWGYKPRSGDVVIDVGAGVGEEALTFSQAIGERGRLICIEAHPQTYRCLEKFVQYNRLRNVTLMHAAVTEPSCGSALIEDSNDYLRNRLDSPTGIPVPATTVDVIHQQLGLNRVHFLKMNIEGAERLAIRGMAEALKHIQVICISCHDFLADKGEGPHLRTKAAVEHFLHESGLRVIHRVGEGLPAYLRDQVWALNQSASAG